MSSHSLFVVAPYVALASLLLVIPLRYQHAQARGRLTRRERALALRLFGRNRAWRLGMLGVLVSHALMLLLPAGILSWNQEPLRMMVLEVLFSVTGVVALFGLLALIVRYARDPALRAYSSMADVALLALLVVQLLSGMSVTVLYRWASSWSAVTLTPYVHSLALLSPRLPLVEAMPYLVKLHVFSAFSALAVLPFTHLPDAVLVPAGRVLQAATAPVVRLAESGRAFVVQRGQRLLHATLWREEDEVG